MDDPASRPAPVDRGLTVLHRLPFWSLAAAVVVVLAVIVVYAASRPQGWQPPVQIAQTDTPTPTSAPTPTPPVVPPDHPELTAGIAAVEAQYMTRIGLAIAPIASPGGVTTLPWVGGSLSTSLAWQTIDVPVAIAVVQDSNQPQDLDYLLKTSIGQDSPAGDEALWQFLGTPQDSNDKTTAVLAATGDAATTLPTSTDGSNVFTDVWWTDADAAQFMGVAFCMSPSWSVFYHLPQGGQVGGFGLASLPNSLVRTGSGDVSGLYSGTTVRQIGVITLNNGARVGVSMSAFANDGTAGTADQAMTAVAALLPALTGYTATNC